MKRIAETLVPALLACASPLASQAGAASDAAPAQAYIDMQGTSIIGDRELPTVLYVVPWRDAAPAGADAQPLSRHAAPAPTHLSRDQVQRQLRHRQRNVSE